MLYGDDFLSGKAPGRLLALAMAFQILAPTYLAKAADGPTSIEKRHDKERWRRITDRYGASLEVPAGTSISHQDDVMLLQGKDFKARLWTVTESRYGFPGHDPAGDMGLKKSDCDSWPPRYRIVKENMAAYSCALHGTMNYYVSRYNNSGGLFFFASYPEKEAESLKETISRMSLSMSQGTRNGILPK
jgi:hypothetical protein